MIIALYCIVLIWTEYYITTKITPHNTEIIVSREEMQKTMTAIAALMSCGKT